MAQTDSQVVATEIERIRESGVLPMCFEQDDVWYSRVGKNIEVIKVSNREARIPMKIRPGGVFGHFNPEQGSMGHGGAAEYEKGVIATSALRQACTWTKKAVWGTDDRRKAVINVFRDNLTDQVDEFRRHLDVICQNDGTGVVATVSAVAASGGKDLLTFNTANDAYAARLLRHGNYYSVYDATLATRRTWTGGTANSGEGQIDLYDPANKQARFNVTAGSAGAIATDKLVISGLTGANPVSIFGIKYHVSNSTVGSWLGLTRSATPEIQANRVNANSTIFSPAYARLVMNKIGDRIGINNKNAYEAWTHPSQLDQFEQLAALIQQIHREGTKDPGVSLNFNVNDFKVAGVPVFGHFNWDRTRWDFMCRKHFGRVETVEPDFYEVDGRRIFPTRNAAGEITAGEEFFLVCVWNLYNVLPCGQGYVDNLPVTANY